ncbi:MAG: hypothetical protein HZA67_00395 [Rhodospirillales bacterium]|jgi:hypothetical protein|nr:hypothetical protein [Rhodospirillales bacterium]
MRPVLIDLEASSLNKDFPIKVGWVEADEDNRLKGQAHLIRPADEWLQSFIWDRGAQVVALHWHRPLAGNGAGAA